MNEQVQWYVTIAGNAVGPVSTDLVLRGIKHKKIATEAYVCVVGASEWQALTDVPEFHGALRENGLLPSGSIDSQPANGNDPSATRADARWSAPMASGEVLRSTEEADEAETTSQFQSSRHAESASDREAQVDLPAQTTAHAADSESEPTPAGSPLNGAQAPEPDFRAQAQSIDVDIDVPIDEPETPSIDWNQGFVEYFLVNSDVTLPDEQQLLHSLTTTPHETFLHDEPMWNLALCLAFGSNALASVAADVFFDVVAAHALHDRVEWMARTLLSRGFMPSGIPHLAGNRAIECLRLACPDELRVQLESQLGL